MVHMFLGKFFSLSTKRARESNFCEPNLCEPSSHIFSGNFILWFTLFQSSQISGEPVNHGSQITQRPFFHQLWANHLPLDISRRRLYFGILWVDFKMILYQMLSWNQSFNSAVHLLLRLVSNLTRQSFYILFYYHLSGFCIFTKEVVFFK